MFSAISHCRLALNDRQPSVLDWCPAKTIPLNHCSVRLMVSHTRPITRKLQANECLEVPLNTLLSNIHNACVKTLGLMAGGSTLHEGVNWVLV